MSENGYGRATRVTKHASDVTEASVLSQLAEKCEKALGADRGLDEQISIYVLQQKAMARGEIRKIVGCLYASPYTSSVDVALTLIPEDHDWIIEHVNGGLTIGARVGHNDPDRTSWGENAALALCAAALRARAALTPSHQSEGEGV